MRPIDKKNIQLLKAIEKKLNANPKPDHNAVRGHESKPGKSK